MSEMFDDLKELKAMLENGEITVSEYDRLKTDLLAEGVAPAEPVDPMAGKPAGWYDDPTGKSDHQAFWDDNAWTGQTRPKPPPAVPSKARLGGSIYATSSPQLPSAIPKPKPGTEGKQPFYKRPIGAVIIGLIVLLIAMSMFGDSGGSSGGGGGSPTPTVNNGTQVGAYVVCQQFVEDRLKSPSSAEFGGPYSRVTQTVSTGRYKVSTYVDAQNSFGAMIRTDFICEVTHTSGESYRLESLVMDE